MCIRLTYNLFIVEAKQPRAAKVQAAARVKKIKTEDAADDEDDDGGMLSCALLFVCTYNFSL